MLAELPEAGPACNRLDRSGTRRTLLRKTQYHIYYRIDRAAGLVNILALWHTARRRPPRL
ncbi:MAG: type II toxin-antitoxin system RelE/ParE family toxin [Polyangiaceae bacterium]|nr:type II toxin-antitoxin system RelE/ParE family toxin [Polyangiaceae bacterium]